MEDNDNRLLIRGARVYDHDGDVAMPAIADILIEGTDILAVSPDIGADEAAGAAVIEGAGRLALPGFVNAHYHSHDVLCRGLFEELTLEMWLLYTLPLGGHRSLDEVRARTLVGAIENLRSGITTVQDMLGLIPLDQDYLDVVVKAYDDAGVRVVFSPMVFDIPSVGMLPFKDMLPADIQSMMGDQAAGAPEQLAFLDAQLDRHPAKGRLHWAVAPFAPQRCTPELLGGCADLAERRDLQIYTHVYETRGQVLIAQQSFADHGGSFMGYFESVGMLGPRLNIVHSVWITRAEMDRMAAADAGIVLNHLSNLKLKSGIAPVKDMREAGVRLALGCDNCSGSDVQNMNQAMKLFCLFNAVSDPEPGPPLAHVAIRMASEGGARSAGLHDRVGAIRPGMAADIILYDLNDIAYLPFNNAARQVVYSETGRGVDMVIVNGRVVLDGDALATVDEQALRDEVRGLMGTFIKDYDAIRAEREKALPYMEEMQRRVWSHDLPMMRFLERTLK